MLPIKSISTASGDFNIKERSLEDSETLNYYQGCKQKRGVSSLSSVPKSKFCERNIYVNLKNSSDLYCVSQDDLSNLDKVKSLFKKIAIDAPIETTGLYAGYTWLHWACMKGHLMVVNLLILDFNANLDVVAADGLQPIHLACLYNHNSIVELLANLDANLDAEFTKYHLKRYVNNKYISDFGDSIPLIAYAILERKYEVTQALVWCGANLKIVSSTNKTLLMYCFLNRFYEDQFSYKLNDRDYLNVRDNDGLSAIHYILHPERFLNRRYSNYDDFTHSYQLISILIKSGVDITSIANGDSDTMLLNAAAYRCAEDILKIILPYHMYITKSKALYNVTLPYEKSHEIFEDYRWRRKKCTELIIKDIINRNTFGLHVPAEEIKLMNQLVRTVKKIEILVNNYKKNFIEAILKNKTIEYGNMTITYFDFIQLFSNEKKLRLLVKNKTLLTSFKKFNEKGISSDYFYFQVQLEIKIKNALTRVDLLEKLKKVAQLREAIPLPYELIIEISEYLRNEEFELLINAFYV